MKTSLVCLGKLFYSTNKKVLRYIIHVMLLTKLLQLRTSILKLTKSSFIPEDYQTQNCFLQKT